MASITVYVCDVCGAACEPVDDTLFLTASTETTELIWTDICTECNEWLRGAISDLELYSKERKKEL
jgi:hypothetical protein